jgi:hypothetical protein
MVARRSLFVLAAMLLASACSTPRDDALPDGSSCGSYAIPQGDYDPAEFRVQQECLLDAFEAGRRATLMYRFPTDEGDPIEVQLTVVDRGVVDVSTDETEDPYGSGVVRTERCTKLEVELDHFEATNCVAVA